MVCQSTNVFLRGKCLPIAGSLPIQHINTAFFPSETEMPVHFSCSLQKGLKFQISWPKIPRTWDLPDERLSSTCNLVAKKNTNHSYQANDDLRGLNLLSSRNGSNILTCFDMDLIHKPHVKAASVLSELENDDEIAKHSETESLISEGCSDQSECLWLSSDCLSASLRSSNCHLHGVWNLSLDDRFFSVVSVSCGSSVILDGRISVFDGSRVNPLEEAALVLDRTPGGVEKVSEEGPQVSEIVAWLYNSLDNDPKDYSFSSIESASSNDHSLYEDSSAVESSWTSLSTHEDTSSQMSDFDRTDIWVSLLNFKGEDFDWASDEVHGFDVFHSDFPSPSYCIKEKSKIKSSDSSIRTLDDENLSFNLPSKTAMESKRQSISDKSVNDFESFDADEPLFWPFDRSSYQCPEWNYCMSPCKNSKEISNSERIFSPNSIRLRLCEGKGSLLQRRGMQKGYTKTVFGPRLTASNFMGFRTRDGNRNNVGVARPSRLSSSTQVSSEQHSHSISLKKRTPKMKDNPSWTSSGKLLPCQLQHQLSSQDELQSCRNMNNGISSGMEKPTEIKGDQQKMLKQLLFETLDSDYQRFLIEGFASNTEVPIETLVGLNEFDGHEGIEADFDEGRFSFDGGL